jgi:hypothetical protein
MPTTRRQRRVDADVAKTGAEWREKAIRNIGQCRLVLLRPHHRRIRARHLGRLVRTLHEAALPAAR